jgi:CDK-activating kinase assembly factor MAT1
MEEENDDYLFRCAICGTAESDSSNLGATATLQTNATVRCGHQFCNACIDREMARRREFPCPICKTLVKRVTLTQRTLDAVQCEKDTSWRRRLLAVYNKTESDFATLKEYNDYLEEVEDMIYAIVNEEPNAEECKAKIKEYEQAHRTEIVIRQSQRADLERSIQDQIAAEQLETQRNRDYLEQEQKAMKITKRKLKQESTEVLLGEREEVSAELTLAQMQGYRNVIKRGNRQQAAVFVSPRVREPAGGWITRETLDREMHRKRQAAGGGIPVGSIASNERNWNETVHSLFAIRTHYHNA